MQPKLHASQTTYGAQVALHGMFGRGAKPSREDVAAVLEAGGATLVPVAQALAAGADLAVTHADCPSSDPKVLPGCLKLPCARLLPLPKKTGS